MRMTTQTPDIIVEQQFSQNCSEVWRALTQPDIMRQWYFENIPDFQAKAGFECSFRVQSDSGTFTHRWLVNEVEEGHKLSYAWRYEEYPGSYTTSFVLNPQHQGCLLKLIARVEEDFPDGVPEFTREACLGGWQYFIQQRLDEYFKPKY